MPKTKKQNLYDDKDASIPIPAWVSVLLAIIAYLVCHQYAVTEIPAPTSIAQVREAFASQLIQSLAIAGQYFFPTLFLLNALTAAYRRKVRSKLFEDVQKRPSVPGLNDMSWQEFELLVGEAFRRQGYRVSETGGEGADGGVDLVLKRNNEKYLVQCKQWKAYKVGVTIVRELYGVMAAASAAGGFVVTSGEFTQEAKSFAQGLNITLIDGNQLAAMIRNIRLRPKTILVAAHPTFQNEQAETEEPTCPKCGNAMIKRTAKQGVNEGKMFWGCSGFPQCRGVVIP